MKQSSRELLAQSYGLAAHGLDKPRIPALDSELMAMLDQPPGHGGAIALLEQWLAGWDAANLAAILTDKEV